jgi:hypothetical protein
MTEPEPTPSDPATGHPAVDGALADLAGVSDRPPAEQVGAYEAVHSVLQDVLRDIEG